MARLRLVITTTKSGYAIAPNKETKTTPAPIANKLHFSLQAQQQQQQTSDTTFLLNVVLATTITMLTRISRCTIAGGGEDCWKKIKVAGAGCQAAEHMGATRRAYMYISGN